MTLIVQQWLICDGVIDGVHCHNVFGVDDSYRKGSKQRENAKEEGWSSNHQKATDYCPSCRSGNEMGTKSTKIHYADCPNGKMKTLCGLDIGVVKWSVDWKEVDCGHCDIIFRRQNE